MQVMSDLAQNFLIQFPMGPLNKYLAYESLNLIQLKQNLIESEINVLQLLIGAVIQNRLDILQELPVSMIINNFINPEDGNSLLQIAILYRNLEVINYLLSLPNVDLEHKNDEGDSSLKIAFDKLSQRQFNFEVIIIKLIETGANCDNILNEINCYNKYDNLLQYALDVVCVELSIYLMQKGFDVNLEDSSGFTPLWVCLDAIYDDNIEAELVIALLYYGADPTLGTMYGYNSFEYAVKFCSYPIEEALFYYIFDEFSSLDIHFEVLLILANRKSPFFYETIKFTKNVILGHTTLNYYHLIFLIDCEYLKVLVEKCGDVIREIFTQVESTDGEMCSECDRMCLGNLELLLQTDLRDDTINFVVTLSDKFYFYIFIGFGFNDDTVLDYLCYLLSYGLQLNESNLNTFYKRYGYGELLKIILHTDIETNSTKKYITDVFLIFLYDITVDLESYLEGYYKYSVKNIGKLLHYFSHPKLRQLCDEKQIGKIQQPEIPLLVELSRNVFRKYFIKIFNIKNAKEFYSLLNGLPVSYMHKKIITYETELY